MKSLHPETAPHPALIAKRAFKMERQGRYEECLAALAEYWRDTEEIPDVSGLRPVEAAEILLRCGSAIGFWGHNKQIAHGQEMSKNLLTGARERFLSLEETYKVAECENYLSLGYWRTGELNEAEIWIRESLSHKLPQSSDVRMYSQVIQNLILLSQKEYEKVCENFRALRESFCLYADDFLKGSLETNYGVAVKNKGDIANALPFLERARDHFRRSRNKAYVALAENNLAQIYKAERRYGAAHDAIDRSTKLFKQLKDETRAGFSLDTKAQIYFAEDRFEEARVTIEKSIRIVRKSENAAYLSETILTRAKILLLLDDFVSATTALIEAFDIARMRVSETAAKLLIVEFESALNERDLRRTEIAKPNKSGVAEGELELVMPPSISHFDDYQGVWINTTHLDGIGVKIGSLAVVVNEKVKRGDPVAIAEKATDAVSCGFFDSDFGIICLEGGDCEPRLFDENDVKILGKIVGVCNSGKTADGKMIVEPIPH